MANENNSNGTSREALNAADLYYGRILSMFEALGKLNKIDGVYNKLPELKSGQYVPPEVQALYNGRYKRNPRTIENLHDGYESTAKRCILYMRQALDFLHIEYTEEDFTDFETLARSTQNETKFRKKVGGHVKTMQNKAKKEIQRRLNGEPAEEIRIESPAELLRWFQDSRSRAKKKH